MIQIILISLISFFVIKITMNLFLEHKKTEWETTLSNEKQYFFLAQTTLCSECDCIFSSKDFKTCPFCGNTNSFLISKTFNLPENPIRISKECV